MNDTSKTGRWISFNVNSLEDYIIAEADRKLGDHIKSLSVFNKALLSIQKVVDVVELAPWWMS